MGLIDFILNVASLLLWLNWRFIRFDPLSRPVALTLVGTLKRAGSSVSPRRKLLLALAALLLIRAVVYRLIGPAVNWTPHLQLGVVAPVFPSKTFAGMLLFSLLSFGLTLAAFCLWLLFLTLLNARVPDTDPIQKLVRTHLGRVARWPFVVKLFLPLACAALLWLVLHPLLVRGGIVPHAKSIARVLQQGLLIGVGAYLVWKYVIASLLLLHLINSYVYLGNHPVWNYVNLTSRKLLAPLRGLRLQFARIDFSPVVGIAAVFLFAEGAAYWLTKLYPN